MLEYIPRPGSKTETAVAYLRAHGGAATAIDLCEAMDTSRKNLPSQFKAAIDNGLLEACALPDGMGYRLVGIDAPGTKRESPTPRPSSRKSRASESRGEMILGDRVGWNLPIFKKGMP
jgi:hypothetical protein